MQKKIKVAEFVTRLEFGGVESMILNYVNNFSERDVFDFHIITQDINSQDCIDLFKKNGFKVHVVTHKRKSIMKNVIEINTLLKSEKYDVVHSHMTLTNFYVMFMAKINGSRVRISHSHNAFLQTNVLKRAFSYILKFFNKLFSNVWMACGEEAAIYMYGEKAYIKDKVTILLNAINIDEYKYDEHVRKKIREQYAIGDSFCVGHIGRFSEQKNHKFLLRVFEGVIKEWPDAKLMLIGTGDLYEKIEREVVDKDLTEYVIFVGTVTNANEYYQAMDVLVLPSLYEGLPVVLIEAQAADLPCIVSKNVDIKCKISDNISFESICEENVNSWISLILANKYHKRNHNILENIEQAGYNIKTEARKLEEIYRESFHDEKK